LIRSHRDLKVWKAGIELSVEVYRLTEGYPKSETFGLVSQMRRAASSVPANIAEGCGRQHKNEFLQFLHIAKGSLYELDTYFHLSEALGHADTDVFERLRQRVDEVGKMLHGLIGSIKEAKTAALADKVGGRRSITSN
jgi:four helix bundle protein